MAATFLRDGPSCAPQGHRPTARTPSPGAWGAFTLFQPLNGLERESGLLEDGIECGAPMLVPVELLCSGLPKKTCPLHDVM